MNNKRKQYLKELAWEYDVPEAVVFSLANFLGPNEDYDGLVSSLEDYHYMFDVEDNDDIYAGEYSEI